MQFNTMAQILLHKGLSYIIRDKYLSVLLAISIKISMMHAFVFFMKAFAHRKMAFSTCTNEKYTINNKCEQSKDKYYERYH